MLGVALAVTRRALQPMPHLVHVPPADTEPRP
jgi:hypothetical protein